MDLMIIKKPKTMARPRIANPSSSHMITF